MGREAVCRVECDGRVAEAKALLETDEVVLRGTFRRRFLFAAILEARAEAGRLYIVTTASSVALDLGDQAAHWANRITNPRSRLDKLGVKEGQAVCLIGVAEPGFASEIREAGAAVVPTSDGGLDMIFFQANEAAALDRLAELRGRLKPAGGIWVITERGRPEIADTVVMAAAKRQGLVDVKVCRFSDSHTALKLVIPRSQR